MTTAGSAEINALIAGELHDPHSLLGKHPAPGGMIVRTWRPDATAVRILVEGKRVATLDRTNPAGLFEGWVRGDLDDYEIEVEYARGQSFILRDPYAFMPTLGDVDIHLASEGTHRKLYQKLGAHTMTMRGIHGVGFAVWAPNARSVRVVGDFNSWDGRLNPMRQMGSSGIWELFVPGIGPGALYKFELRTPDGELKVKTDPFAFATEAPPRNECIVHASDYRFGDAEWMEARKSADWLTRPMSIYEVHLGSWRRTPDGHALNYRDSARQLAEYCNEMGFTHVELMPLAEHPFGGSWGYQVSNYFSPTARFGSPDDFRFLIDTLHKAGIGVIMDWVPAHFPRDEWALARYDGTALFEHLDPRMGEHPDWGTLVFNFGRNEVRNFLLSNALYWLDEFHVDGLRVDAVASMLYLDYSRAADQWIPNKFGGRENLEAIDFLKELNTVVYGEHPGVLMIAEESTAWPGVSRPTYVGGLGFGFKWSMGWMHDVLEYFRKDPVHRRFHHNLLTFSMMYAYSENFILPLSHDEVVHGKGSLYGKMPGDRWQKFANLRALFAFMWAHPGKQMLFMGGELGQEREWDHDRSLDWHLLDDPFNAGLQRLVADLNWAYRGTPALWERDFSHEGFRWIDANDADHNVLSFYRSNAAGDDVLVCLCNLSPVPRLEFRVGLPHPGDYFEVVNTDSETYGGSNVGNLGAVRAEQHPWHGLDWSAIVALPPLGVLWLRQEPRSQ